MKPIKFNAPGNATLATLKAAYPAPKGATHFYFVAGSRRPVIGLLKDLDLLAGCQGTLEFGSAVFTGSGRSRTMKEFISWEPTPLTREQLIARTKKYAKLLQVLLRDGVESELVNFWDEDMPESKAKKGDYYWQGDGSNVGVNKFELEEAATLK